MRSLIADAAALYAGLRRMVEPTPVYSNRVQCIECGRVSREDERGWTARLTVDEDEPVEVVAYCPECDEREFDDPL